MKITSGRLSRKSWTDQDLTHLKIAYRNGASLKMMAEILGRSTTAVNKALSRYGARPLGSQPRGVRPRTLTKPVTLKLVQQKIKELDTCQDTLGNSDISATFNPQAMRAYEALQDHSRQKRVELSKWVTLEDLTIYLKKKGYPIMLKKQGEQKGYWIRQKGFLTPARLLMFVNEMRVENHKPPFYVEQLTEA
jgi:transposase